MNTHETITAKLRKIQALAQSGYAGEKDNAQRLLTALLDKHGLTEADLVNETQSECIFTLKHTWEKKLLVQLYCMIRDVRVCKYAHRKEGKTKIIYLTLTHLEYTDIRAAYAHYHPMLEAGHARLRRQLRHLPDAFIAQYEIYGTATDERGRAPSHAAMEAMLAAMRQMKGDKWQKSHGSLTDTLQLDFSA